MFLMNLEDRPAPLQAVHDYHHLRAHRFDPSLVTLYEILLEKKSYFKIGLRRKSSVLIPGQACKGS